jgi:ABC-type antimicrobial peptide transport system permease subunit
MVLKTLDVLGTLHGYVIAPRIEQISGDLLSVNQGTLYPVPLTLELREFGIRQALGADARVIFRDVMARAAHSVGIGLALGFVGTLLMTRHLGNLLFGVPPLDPVTIASAYLVLVAAAWIASYVPARRAARVDPLVALRYE